MLHCNNCGSTNVDIQVMQEKYVKKKTEGIIKKILMFPLRALLWIVLTPYMFLLKLFSKDKYEEKYEIRKVLICKDCGHVE